MSLLDIFKKKAKTFLTSDVTSVKVLGAGCPNCHKLFETVKSAMPELGINVEVDYITEKEEVAKYKVPALPAVLVNDVVVSAGKMLTIDDVKNMFK